MKMKLMKKEKKREYSGRDDGEEERKENCIGNFSVVIC
jgi:hypothetical protein